MTNVGELEIGGSISVEDIESGLGRVERGFDNIEAKTDGLNADFERMAQTSAKLGKTLIGIGLAGTVAIIALTKGSPAVAGSMAKMKVKAGELSRSLGEALAPSFEMVSEAFADFVGWVADHEDSIAYFSETIIGGLIDSLDGLQTAWSWITSNVNDFLVTIGVDWDLGDVGNYLMEHFGPEAVAGIIGAGVGFAVAGPPGALVGGAAAATTVGVGRRVSDPQLVLGETMFVGGLLSLLSGFSQSTLRRVVGMTLTDGI